MWHYFTAARSKPEREAEPETGITAEFSEIFPKAYTALGQELSVRASLQYSKSTHPLKNPPHWALNKQWESITAELCHSFTFWHFPDGSCNSAARRSSGPAVQAQSSCWGLLPKILPTAAISETGSPEGTLLYELSLSTWNRSHFVTPHSALNPPRPFSMKQSWQSLLSRHHHHAPRRWRSRSSLVDEINRALDVGSEPREITQSKTQTLALSETAIPKALPTLDHTPSKRCTLQLHRTLKKQQTENAQPPWAQALILTNKISLLAKSTQLSNSDLFQQGSEICLCIHTCTPLQWQWKMLSKKVEEEQ